TSNEPKHETRKRAAGRWTKAGCTKTPPTTRPALRAPTIRIIRGRRRRTAAMTPRTEAPARYDARMRVSLGAVALSGGALAFCALAFFGASAAFSVAAGAGLATANLWALARIVTELLPDERSARQAGEGGAVSRAATNKAPWTV